MYRSEWTCILTRCRNKGCMLTSPWPSLRLPTKYAMAFGMVRRPAESAALRVWRVTCSTQMQHEQLSAKKATAPTESWFLSGFHLMEIPLHTKEYLQKATWKSQPWFSCRETSRSKWLWLKIFKILYQGNTNIQRGLSLLGGSGRYTQFWPFFNIIVSQISVPSTRVFKVAHISIDELKILKASILETSILGINAFGPQPNTSHNWCLDKAKGQQNHSHAAQPNKPWLARAGGMEHARVNDLYSTPLGP